MYISKLNLTTDENEIIDFICKYSFATIVTTKDDRPNASHLPFVISKKEGKTILTSHFAKANQQWTELSAHETLVIFTEPHAYISPKHYDKEMNVPTWNYIAVHAYGKAKVISDREQTMKIIEKTIHNYEADYLPQWNSLPEAYKLKMLNGIVAFEIEVTSFQASKKLSQNKTEDEKQRIITALKASPNNIESELGIYMEKES
ncbi:FMN-binding negative transcriptional regulator [Pedobacter cryoconitis]|uniref:Transcriptional regulator n=1 Tax=Pedobacter cryoconitis TaxID=188932 RepID=A0A7X0J6R2_9SPHI|nr:FMN-binding negative transcriptional regulator [Pedobacter cryoconitis]MBB6502120.1 transcriptional regulator [Pedobacter cryoconitis]